MLTKPWTLHRECVRHPSPWDTGVVKYFVVVKGDVAMQNLKICTRELPSLVLETSKP